MFQQFWRFNVRKKRYFQKLKSIILLQRRVRFHLLRRSAYSTIIALWFRRRLDFQKRSPAKAHLVTLHETRPITKGTPSSFEGHEIVTTTHKKVPNTNHKICLETSREDDEESEISSNNFKPVFDCNASTPRIASPATEQIDEAVMDSRFSSHIIMIQSMYRGYVIRKRLSFLMKIVRRWQCISSTAFKSRSQQKEAFQENSIKAVITLQCFVRCHQANTRVSTSFNYIYIDFYLSF